MSQKKLKAGILIVVLVLPALVFIFLKSFGDNKFDLPYFFPELDESGQVVITNGDTVFNTIQNFQLLDHDSLNFQLAEQSDIKIVNFFFTRCGTICPISNHNLDRVKETFKLDSRLSYLSISVDPVYDTPSTLKKYIEKNNFKHDSWKFLTGEKAKIYDLAIKEFKIPVSDASTYDSTIKSIDETFIHSDKFLLLDSDNHVRGIYTGTDNEEIDRLKLEIKILLNGLDKQ